MRLIDAVPCGERVVLTLERIGRECDSLRERLCVERRGGVVDLLLHAGAFRARLDLTPTEAREVAVLLVEMADAIERG